MLEQENLEDDKHLEMESKYSFTIENFEGPLDLLCFLISKNKMDIFEISLSELTDKYIEYIDEMQELNLDIATEFLVMASNLLYLKSKKLLPMAKPEEDDDSDVEFTEEELLKRIVEYKKYKEKIEEFKNMYSENFGTFEKEPEKIKVRRELDKNIQMNIKDLFDFYFNIKNKNKLKINEKSRDVEEIVTYEKVTIRSKVKQIIDIFKKKTSFVFGKIYGQDKTKKIDIVTAFLSILELSRLKHVNIEQKDMFGDIVVKKGDIQSLDLSLIDE